MEDVKVYPLNKNEIKAGHKEGRKFGNDYISGIHWHLNHWFIDYSYSTPMFYEHGGLLQYTIRERMLAANGYLTEVADAMNPFIGVDKPYEEYIKMLPGNSGRGLEAAKHLYLILQSIELQYEDKSFEDKYPGVERSQFDPKLPPFPEESDEDKDNGNPPPIPEAA